MLVTSMILLGLFWHLTGFREVSRSMDHLLCEMSGHFNTYETVDCAQKTNAESYSVAGPAGSVREIGEDI